MSLSEEGEIEGERKRQGRKQIKPPRNFPERVNHSERQEGA